MSQETVAADAPNMDDMPLDLQQAGSFDSHFSMGSMADADLLLTLSASNDELGSPKTMDLNLGLSSADHKTSSGADLSGAESQQQQQNRQETVEARDSSDSKPDLMASVDRDGAAGYHPSQAQTQSQARDDASVGGRSTTSHGTRSVGSSKPSYPSHSHSSPYRHHKGQMKPYAGPPGHGPPPPSRYSAPYGGYSRNGYGQYPGHPPPAHSGRYGPPPLLASSNASSSTSVGGGSTSSSRSYIPAGGYRGPPPPHYGHHHASAGYGHPSYPYGPPPYGSSSTRHSGAPSRGGGGFRTGSSVTSAASCKSDAKNEKEASASENNHGDKMDDTPTKSSDGTKKEEASPSTIATAGSNLSSSTQGSKKRSLDSAFHTSSGTSVGSGTSAGSTSKSSPYQHPGYGYHNSHPGYSGYHNSHPSHQHPSHHPHRAPNYGRGGPPPGPYGQSSSSLYHQSPGKPGPSGEGGSHPLGMFQNEKIGHHRRTNSGASSASSLSNAGTSLGSIVGNSTMETDGSLSPSSKKRRQNHSSSMMSPGAASTNAQLSNLTVSDIRDDMASSPATTYNENKHDSIKVSISASPTHNAGDSAKTPVCKNSSKNDARGTNVKKEEIDFGFEGSNAADGKNHDSNISSAFRSNSDGSTSVKTAVKNPALSAIRTESLSFNFDDMLKDDPLLSSHLRGQSFTPLAAGGDLSSPNFNAGLPLAPQLSWSISPSLGDIAEWAEAKKDGKIKGDGSAQIITSKGMEGIADGVDQSITPMSVGACMSFWQDDEVAATVRCENLKTGGKGSISAKGGADTLRLSPENMGPLPIFFDQSMPPPTTNAGESKNKGVRHGFSQQQHNGGNIQSASQIPQPRFHPISAASWAIESPRHPGMAIPGRGHPGRGPPPPIFVSPPMQGADRVRNLRGRAPQGSHPLHVSHHHMSPAGHHGLTSPMVGGQPGMWSPHGPHPHHAMRSPHHMRSPPHMRPLELTPSKRKCVPLKPPLPPKFQGDMEKAKTAQVPEFTTLVNFPAHISQKQSINLPEGMRCCVMCGQACPCNLNGKAAKKTAMGPNGKKIGKDDHLSTSNTISTIPTQNKGLCTMCDVNVWVIIQSGLEIKWCKGCKNFRPWGSFGDKGLATKCVRCRERQREKYAAQKEEKEKVRAERIRTR